MIVAILGAGPAGMSCANACLSFGLSPIVLESSGEVGGIQRGNFHPNLWLLGAPGETGSQMSERMAQHFATLPLNCLRHTEVTRVSGSAGNFQLDLKTPEGSQTLHAAAIVVATGTYPRATAALKDLASRSPRVIIGPLSDSIRDHIRHARVLILGGGDNALDHALFLAQRDNQVRVCTRRGLSARQPFQDSCRNTCGIELVANCLPHSIAVHGEQVMVGSEQDIQAYDWLLVMYGYLPNSEVLAVFSSDLRPALGKGGHILVDTWQRTSVPGIYAAGDVTDSPQPSVPTALAQGLVAARAAERDAGTA
jgi:thioredoxin reductase (NADPH)